MRQVDILCLEGLAKLSPISRSEIIKIEKAYLQVRLGALREVFSGEAIRYIRDLRRSDGNIPREITFFRSFPEISPLFPVYSAGEGSPARRVLFEILNKYRINPEKFIEMFENVHIRGFRFFESEFEKLQQQRERENKPRIVFRENTF